MSKIVCVVPTIRPEQIEKFRKAWQPLFERHKVTLITVWDGENPSIEQEDFYVGEIRDKLENSLDHYPTLYNASRNLFYRFTDSCRNLGFVAAAPLKPDYILTLDDDVTPTDRWVAENYDPIQAHLDVLQKRVPLSWMNTAMDSWYLRGVPYDIRNEAPVMLSHGVWTGTPDFDGETQLKIEKTGRLPYRLPYYDGPIPKGVYFPLCGMNVMIRKEALPYFYFAPMSKDTGLDLHRFGDIWMGLWVQNSFAERGWACYSGGSTVHHTRASDAAKNFEQEKLGRQWNEFLWKLERGEECKDVPSGLLEYRRLWYDKRQRYKNLITSILDNQCQQKDNSKI